MNNYGIKYVVYTNHASFADMHRDIQSLFSAEISKWWTTGSIMNGQNFFEPTLSEEQLALVQTASWYKSHKLYSPFY
jgi:hypothetical protein